MTYGSTPGTQWQTYNAGPGDGNTIREDLSDILSIMSPLDTPLLSMLPQVPVSNPYYDWPIDDIPTPDAVDSEIEGADAVFSNTSALGNDTRFRMGNGTCINSKTVDVSDSARAANMAGIRDEFAYEVWKKTLEMAKQAEFNYHWAQYSAGSNSGAGSARNTEGFISFLYKLGIDAAADKVVGGKAYDTSATGRQSVYVPNYYIPGAKADLTRSILHDNLLTPGWRKGMQVEGAIMLCGAPIKRLVADFALVTATGGEINSRNIPAEASKMIDTIDFIKTDFGTLYINLDRYLDGADDGSGTAPSARVASIVGTGTGSTTKVHTLAKTVLLFQPGMLEIAAYRPAGFTLLAKIGDATKGLVLMETGTKPLNPLAMTGGTDLTAT